MEFFKGKTYDQILPIFQARKLSEEAQKADDLRGRLEILQDEDDDVFVEVTPLAQKVPVVDYQLFLLVERRYPLSRFTLEQLVNVARLQVEEENDVLWKLQRYMHAPLTRKLYIDCGVYHVSSTRGDNIFMLTEKDYPLSNVVMILMLNGKLQVEEDNEMARDLVMKIFMEANKPKSRSLDTSSK
nr:hypothetical protein [Tanacetum cinerariifolium]